MKRTEYEAPTMQVVELQGRQQLLTGSGLNNPTDYTNGGDPFNPAP